MYPYEFTFCCQGEKDSHNYSTVLTRRKPWRLGNWRTYHNGLRTHVHFKILGSGLASRGCWPASNHEINVHLIYDSICNLNSATKSYNLVLPRRIDILVLIILGIAGKLLEFWNFFPGPWKNRSIFLYSWKTPESLWKKFQQLFKQTKTRRSIWLKIVFFFFLYFM